MTIDIHVHPAFFEPINSDPEREALRHYELAIRRNGLASLAHVFNQMRCASLDRLCLLAQDYSERLGACLVSNEEIAYLVSLAPDRFWGLASVDPHDKNAPDKLEEAFTRLKLKGLNLHPGRSRFDPTDSYLEPLWPVCERHNRPVLFHAGLSWEPDTLTEYGHPLRFEALAQKHPQLRICLGHFGWPWIRETAMLLLKYPNVYADTAALYFDSAREFYAQCFTRDIPVSWIDRSLRHQVMFGSDNPRFEQIRMVQALDSLGLRESTLELILGENALVFLGEKEGRGA